MRQGCGCYFGFPCCWAVNDSMYEAQFLALWGWPTVSARFFDRLETPAAGPAWVSNNACQESLSAWLLCRRFFDSEPSADLPLFPALWFLLIRPSLTRTRTNTPAGCPIPRRDCGRQEVDLWDAIGDTDLLPCVRRFSLPRPTTEPVLRTCHQCVILFDEQVPR
jgi:hypothetical protein